MDRPDPRNAGRVDVVVVLARGESLRYGSPKPLARHGTDPRPLLRRVVQGYVDGLGAPVVVATTAGLRDACRACVADLAGVRVSAGPAGGDTARTLGLVWPLLADLSPPCSHVWAHPADLPWVRRRTLAQLQRVSGDAPGRVVRPSWGGRPGHPVVMPAGLLASLAAQAVRARGPWRDLLASEMNKGRVAPLLSVPVADPGVVLDLDEPEGACRAAPERGPGHDA